MAASQAIEITYVPADCGSIIPGKSKAPQVFRDVNIVAKLQEAGVCSISEHNALDSPATYKATSMSQNGVRNEGLNIEVCQRVHRSMTQSLAGQGSILSTFWHHAAQAGSQKRVGFLYIDADTDLASPTDQSSTGIFAGMNMTHLVRSEGALRSMGHSSSVARQPEQQEKEALRILGENVDVILVHLDVDSIDAVMSPLANVPNYTGVDFSQSMWALKVILASEKVGGLTIAEVNPDHDPGLDMITRLTDHVVSMIAARQQTA
ncbi:hypothetical protein SCAR479_13978 [Seiridium cardinale]|uniref:Arginase n=1 Tax=Seiridium cardinale TaxID=138064 RepID=A0ABR2X6F7_9PEZI